MRRRILIVDDEGDIRSVLAEYLGHKGYDVRQASDGVEALEKFEAEPADAVITDIMMPRCGGDTLLRRLRTLAPSLPIIVLSGIYSDVDFKARLLPEADVTMAKPVALSELAEALNRLLGDIEAET